MAVPKRKVSKSRRDMRSANKAIKKKNVIFKFGEVKLSHIDHKYGKRIKKEKE